MLWSAKRSKRKRVNKSSWDLKRRKTFANLVAWEVAVVGRYFRSFVETVPLGGAGARSTNGWSLGEG